MRRALVTLCLAALLLPACGQSPAGPQVRSGQAIGVRATEAPPLSPPVFGANETEIYYDMATFEAMEQLVSGAQRTIRMDYYIFGGPTASRLADLMIAKHRAGVDVKIMLDGSLGVIAELRAQCKPIYERFKAAGVPIAFHDRAPIAPVTKGDRIDHNKYFVVDDQALLGSMNLAKKFYDYHDLMVRVKGPAAAQLLNQFEFDWYYATHPQAPRPDVLVHAGPASFSAPGADAPSQVRVVGTGTGRKTGLEALLPLLNNARQSIHIQMHEIGDTRVLDALEAARDRGVDVKVILDPGVIDPFIPIIHRAPRGILNAIALDRMLKKQMNVRHYRVDATFTTAHMKSAVIDGQILFAGSINWTRGGFEWVSETDLEIHGGRAPQQAQAQFARDWVERAIPAEPPSKTALALCRIYNGR